MRKKLLALLMAAALALSLLAGCGGGESAASALLKLLDGRYPNISIEIDPELEADLRQAISAAEAENAGDDAAVIRAALETALGSTITFRYLGDGQKGDTAFDLVFYAGSDPDKAAQAAYSQWNATFSNVPADGQYGTALAMVETNSGVWMLVKATVEKAGTVDKPDTDDDEPETQEPKDPYTKNADGNYTVNTKDGLQELFNKENDALSATITLTTDQTITGTALLTDTFSGTLKGENGAKIILSDTTRTQGLFNEIGADGKVLNVDIEVSGTINGGGSGNVGAVAGKNYGTIQNCHVAGGTIEGGSGDGVGGIAGYNYKIIQGCSASVQLQYGTYTGGVVGWNDGGGTVTACYSTSAVNGDFAGGVVGENYGGTVTACYSTGAVSGSYAGGVVGENSNGGTITACYHADGEVSGGIAGGVVGFNYDGGSVTACYSTGNVTGTSGGPAGGVVGFNMDTVTACYWSGSPEKGIGSGNTGETTKVTAGGDNDSDEKTVSWETALGVLNDPAKNNSGYTFDGPNMDNPTLTKK